MSLHRSRTGPFIAETASSIALPSAGPAVSRRGLFTACACCAAGLFAAPRGALAIAPGASRSSHSQPSTWNGGSSYLDGWCHRSSRTGCDGRCREPIARTT